MSDTTDVWQKDKKPSRSNKTDKTDKTDKCNSQYMIKPKTHYVTAESLDIDKLSFDLSIFTMLSDTKSIVKIMVNYEYVQGLVAPLNILHENARIYSAYIPQYAEKAFKNTDDMMKLRLNAPIRLTDTDNIVLNNKLECIEAQLISFLITIRSSGYDELVTKYSKSASSYLDSSIVSAAILDLHDGLNNMSVAEFTSSIRTILKKNSEQITDTYRLIPKINSNTNITKLGSKKDNYNNQSVDMKNFYDAMRKINSMNNKDSEYFYECSMIIGISSFVVPTNDKLKISVKPNCSKLEYKLNKASCRRVIKKKKISHPIVLGSLSV
jgi:hypothetical protein